MRHVVNKRDWLNAMACQALGWHGLRFEPPPPDEGARFRMEQGQEVGDCARHLYPDGVLIHNVAGRTREEVTKQFMADPNVQTLFEATVEATPFIAKADILTRFNGGWHVLEVKSSFSDTGGIDALRDDLAYTVMVAQRAGLLVTKASLVLLSRTYRFGGEVRQLFDTVDQTPDALARAAQFDKVAAALAGALLGDQSPPSKLVSACRRCQFFEDQCLGTGIAHTIFEIPSLHHTKLKKLSSAGIVDLAQFPGYIELNERQMRAKPSALTGRPIIEPGLRQALDQLAWPCHYLDFETVATTLPLYESHGCHQQVLTQFSVHHRDHIAAEPRHSQYLADAARDCQHELAEALIKALGTDGSIVVNSSFEKQRISGLSRTFPDLAPKLEPTIGRLVDLLKIVQDNAYHPAFRGSFSIKHVLPALVPDLNYDGLEIRDGGTAMARFAHMAMGMIVGDQVGITREQLLEYCGLDTMAMVRLHEVLESLAA